MMAMNGVILTVLLGSQVKIAVLTPILPICAAASGSEGSFGTWKSNAARSESAGGTQAKSFTVRIGTHPSGELFTLERTERDGRITVSSSILYFDAVSRSFEDFGCSGTQSSRRTDPETVEILRNCGPAAWTKLIRRMEPMRNHLVLEITEHHADGRTDQRRIALEKISEGK